MNTDRELLEMAAKAAGIEWTLDYEDGPMLLLGSFYEEEWNPLEDDGDALRLAVQLCLWVHIGKYHVSIFGTKIEEDCKHDRGVATRRAIVRAAAEIGRAKP